MCLKFITALIKRKEDKEIFSQKKFDFLKLEYQEIKNKAGKEADLKNTKNREYDKRSNSICPKCRSDKTVDKISRIQGRLDGEINGSSTLFSGTLYGSIHGKIDTNEINKCPTCGNEWKKENTEYLTGREVLHAELSRVGYYLTEHRQVKDCVFDPTDLNEKYNSLEEKKAALQKEAETYWAISGIQEFWTEFSIEALLATANEILDGWGKESFLEDWDESKLKIIGLKNLDESEKFKAFTLK